MFDFNDVYNSCREFVSENISLIEHIGKSDNQRVKLNLENLIEHELESNFVLTTMSGISIVFKVENGTEVCYRFNYEDFTR